MLKTLLAVLLVTVSLAGCSEKETVKTETVPVDRNVTINNPPPAPAQNTNTVIRENRTIVHDAPAAAPAANTTIINNSNSSPNP